MCVRVIVFVGEEVGFEGCWELTIVFVDFVVLVVEVGKIGVVVVI